MLVRKIIHDNGDVTTIYKLPDGRLIGAREPNPEASKRSYNMLCAIFKNAEEMRERNRAIE